jgi:hypothetical protein
MSLDDDRYCAVALPVMAAIQMGHCATARREAQGVVNLSGTIVATAPVSAPAKSRQPMR